MQAFFVEFSFQQSSKSASKSGSSPSSPEEPSKMISPINSSSSKFRFSECKKPLLPSKCSSAGGKGGAGFSGGAGTGGGGRKGSGRG